MKDDGLLDRNFLRGPEGDAINALLAAVGHNLRLLRRWLAWLCALLLGALIPAADGNAADITPATTPITA
jgi:IS5 family transposase